MTLLKQIQADREAAIGLIQVLLETFQETAA